MELPVARDAANMARANDQQLGLYFFSCIMTTLRRLKFKISYFRYMVEAPCYRMEGR
jgi:hypothetical protein